MLIDQKIDLGEAQGEGSLQVKFVKSQFSYDYEHWQVSHQNHWAISRYLQDPCIERLSLVLWIWVTLLANS